MKSRTLLPLLSLLLAASCSASNGATPDAAVTSDSGNTPTDTPATDVPASQDVPRLDAPAIDAPAIDAPAIDEPAIDAPAIDAGTDVPATGDGCVRPDIPLNNPRQDCRAGGDSACPPGYSCLSFSGVVLQQFCGRPCRSDCDCASGDACGSYTDKAGTHPICVVAPTASR